MTARVRHRHNWLLTICPITRTQVMGHIQRGFYAPENRDVWWHCPTCQGWHIIVREQADLAVEAADMAPM